MHANKIATMIALTSMLSVPVYAQDRPKDDTPFPGEVSTNWIAFYRGEELTRAQSPEQGMGEEKTDISKTLSFGHKGFTINMYVIYQKSSEEKDNDKKSDGERPYVVQAFCKAYDNQTKERLWDITFIETKDGKNKPETAIFYVSQKDHPSPFNMDDWIALEGGREKSVLDGVGAKIYLRLPDHIQWAKAVMVKDANSRLQLGGYYPGIEQSAIKVTQLCDPHISKSGSMNKDYASLELIVGEMTVRMQ